MILQSTLRVIRELSYIISLSSRIRLRAVKTKTHGCKHPWALDSLSFGLAG